MSYSIFSPAMAQDAAVAGAQQPSLLMNLVPLVLIIAVFYFLIIRPQQKRLKAHQAMIDSIARKDRIVTAGGIVGTVSKVESDGNLKVEIADGVQVEVVRGTVTTVLERVVASNSNVNAEDKAEKKPAKSKPDARKSPAKRTASSRKTSASKAKK